MRLLMLERDAQLSSVMRRGLEAHQFQVIAVHTVAHAIACVRAEKFAAALLDCDLLEEHELEHFTGLPLVFTATCVEPVGSHRFFGRGPLLGKPFTSTQLLAALQPVRASWAERDDRLIDVLRRANSLRESFSLRVEDTLLVIERGELAHAERGRRRGEQALADALAFSQPALTRLPTRPYVRTIERPFHSLMLELLERIEAREQGEP